MVTVKAQNAGLQLDQFGDVRRHGVLVGQVRNVGNDGHEAVIKVALNPSSAKDIPPNVDIEILPTTLFGQKYINIEDPADPSSKSHEQRRRDPGLAGDHQRRAAEDPGRPVPAAALDPARPT